MQLKKVAWSPEGVAPAELTAVLVPAGGLTHKDWIESLADRVQNLMDREQDKEAVMEWACKTLDLPTASPKYAGQTLVVGNWNLLTHLNLALETEFPVTVLKEDESAAIGIEETDLMAWVELAASQVSASSLD